MIFVHNPQGSKETAILFNNIGAIGWTTFANFYLWLILELSGKTKKINNHWLFIMLLWPAALTIFLNWNNQIFSDFVKQYYGWQGVFLENAAVYFFLFYSLVFMLSGLVINFSLIKDRQDLVRRKQAKIIFWSVLFSLFLGATSDVILPLSGIHELPDMASFFILAWSIGLVYAMVKYKFLIISPTSAAGNIIDTMFDSLFLLDMKGNIAFVNKATETLMEYKTGELKGESIKILFADQEIASNIVEKILTKGDLKNREFFFATRNKKLLPVLFSSSLLMDENKNAAGYVCVARDISDHKKLESELLKSKKLESIGLLAGGIAHDFNNLLSIILGNLSIVLEEFEPGQRIYNALHRAEEASLKATKLAAKFIAFAPGGLLERVKINLSSIFEQVKSSIDFEPGVTMDMDYPTGIEPIYGDEKQILLLIENLIRNAAEAMPQGGVIQVHAENKSFDDDSKLLLKKGNYVLLEIIDSGVGVSAANIERIFDPYFSTKERMAQKGMGLGLTICYSIVKKHEGHISFESKEGEGSKVTLFLRAYKQDI